MKCNFQAEVVTRLSFPLCTHKVCEWRSRTLSTKGSLPNNKSHWDLGHSTFMPIWHPESIRSLERWDQDVQAGTMQLTQCAGGTKRAQKCHSQKKSLSCWKHLPGHNALTQTALTPLVLQQPLSRLDSWEWSQAVGRAWCSSMGIAAVAAASPLRAVPWQT